MNEAHLRNCVGLFFLGPFMIWYSYRKGPPELARKIMFWSGVTVLSTSGLGYLGSRLGSDLGVGNLLQAASPKPKEKGVGKPEPAPAPAAPAAPAGGFVSTPIIDIKGVAA